MHFLDALRSRLRAISILTLLVISSFSTNLAAQGNIKLIIAIPGPGNMLFMPIELAKKIGADTAEGVELEIRFFGGGPQAFQDMLEKNSDFSAGGMPALAAQRASGKPVLCIVPISRVPAYSLMVRNDLKGKIRKIADLKGHVIGVKGHTKGGRSTTQMFTEFQLTRAGVAIDSVNFVPAGQSYNDQMAAMVSGSVDAIMGDEPFATRMQKEKVGFYLADFHDTRIVRKMMGGLFLNAHVGTREDVVREHPDSAEKMVRTIRRTLVWIKQHSAQEIVNALNLPTAEARDALQSSLSKYKDMYSPDGKFSDEQIKTSEAFFHQVSKDDPNAHALTYKSFIVDKWAGRSP
jgi:NitT/TauT family transport system substrate-binding protein